MLSRAALPSELEGWCEENAWLPYIPIRRFLGDAARREGMSDLGWLACRHAGAQQGVYGCAGARPPEFML